MRLAVVDGHSDEPSCLGVPPFLSPYPRYLAGAAKELGWDCLYLTADEARALGLAHEAPALPGLDSASRARGKARGLLACDLLAVTGGSSVPGKYLRGMPLSVREIAEVASKFRGPKLLGGPLARFSPDALGPARGLFDHVARRDAEASLHDLIRTGKWTDRDRTVEEGDRWARLGAGIASQHPDHPGQLTVELSLFRGCVRYLSGGCGFCTDVLYGRPVFREPEAVAGEVAELSAAGAVNFRLGGASCLFTYKAEGVGREECPRPSPDAVEALLTGVRRAAPGLAVLHTDNANPAVIASHPEPSRRILGLLARHCTGGNVLSLGLESADPAVREQNNLNSTPEQALEAVRLINEAGRQASPSGLPALLPGLNFVFGLRGESPRTALLDLEFLKRVVAEGLLLRRVNIRQVLPLRHGYGPPRSRGAFFRFKQAVRSGIDRPMLERLVPDGTVLRRVFPEVTVGKLTFGRQAGTYPLLVGMPALPELSGPLDVVVVDRGERSVTALPVPVRMNRLPPSALALVRGLGRKRAARLVRGRPFTGYEAAAAALDDPRVLAPYRDVLSFQ